MRANKGQKVDAVWPSDGEVRAALDSLIANAEFGASERRRAFLRFVVEEELAGRGHSLKGFTIAIAVFGRDETFDPKTDPVVRLEALRLRRDLAIYYAGPGADDPICISMPKGGYVPLFSRREVAQAESTPSRQAHRPFSEEPSSETTEPTDTVDALGAHDARPPLTTIAAVGAVATFALLLAVAWLMRAEPPPADPLAARGYPRVAIMPFTAVGASEDARTLSAGLGMELVRDLQRFEALRLYQPPDGSDLRSVAARLQHEPGAAYAVGGQIQIEGDQVRIDANLHDLSSDEVIWSEGYAVPLRPETLIQLRESVAGQIATALGQPYGPIGTQLVQRAAAEASSLDSYLCVMQAYDYRRDFSAAAFAPTLACLEAAVARDPDYSDAWAMLGWLYLDAGRFEFPGAAPIETEYALALDAARQALALAPDSVLALKALSSIQHYRGRYEESERLARRAVELNPHDPDTLAQLGWRLAARGGFDEGVLLLHEAIDRSVNPPVWYFHLLAIDHLMKGEYAEMRRVAERASLTGRPGAESLLAIAAGGLGDRETARAALSRIGPAWDAEADFRRNGFCDEIVAALMNGLETARRLAGVQAHP